MALPVTRAVLGVFEPADFLAGEAVNQHVCPAVSVEVVGEGEEAIRVGVVDAERAFEAGDGFFDAVGFLEFEAGVGGVDFAALLEVRPFVPVGAGNDIHLAVAVEVADRRAFGPELVGHSDLFEGVEKLGGASIRRGGQAENCGQENSSHGVMLGSSAGAGQAA